MSQTGFVNEIASDRDSLREEVLAGLGASPKTLPCKLFYNRRGSQLFDEICTLPEYYPTRTEVGIMARWAGEMAKVIGPGACVIEPGAGSSVKIRHLLDALDAPAGYVPMDISADHLRSAAAGIEKDYPGLDVCPVEADYTQPVKWSAAMPPCDRRVVFYPGSTIGNFLPDEAQGFLGRMRGLVGVGGGLLIGVDLFKDASIVEPA